MVFPARSTGQETVAEIDQAAQGHKGKQDGLLQPHGVGDAGLFFENGAGPHMGAGTGFGTLQKDGIFEIAALQFYMGADVAVVHGKGRFKAQFSAVTDQGVGAEQFTSGVDGRLFGDPGAIHLITDDRRVEINPVFRFIFHVGHSSNFSSDYRIEPSPRQAAGRVHRKDESRFSVRSLTLPQTARNALAIAVQSG